LAARLTAMAAAPVGAVVAGARTMAAGGALRWLLCARCCSGGCANGGGEKLRCCDVKVVVLLMVAELVQPWLLREVQRT